jgi:hypothetical protein
MPFGSSRLFQRYQLGDVAVKGVPVIGIQHQSSDILMAGEALDAPQVAFSHIQSAC